MNAPCFVYFPPTGGLHQNKHIVYIVSMTNLGAHKLKQYRSTFVLGLSSGDTPEQGVTQKVMADYLGVSAMLVSYLENGLRTPGFKLALKLERLGIADVSDWTRPAPDAAAA